jgi:hypothetical protein
MTSAAPAAICPIVRAILMWLSVYVYGFFEVVLHFQIELLQHDDCRDFRAL